MKAVVLSVVFIIAASISSAEPFVIEDGSRLDFYRWPEFEAHYVYPSSEPGDPAVEFVGISGERRPDGTYALTVSGIDPTAAFPHRRCKQTVIATVDGDGLSVNETSIAFGRFTLRPDGEYLRVTQTEPGGCSVPGRYFLPKPVD